MATRTTTAPAPPTEHLWKQDDIAAYLRCSDATPVTKLPGFPSRQDLPGVNGGRWYGPHVIAFFERRSAGGERAMSTTTPPERPSIPPIVPKSGKAVA